MNEHLLHNRNESEVHIIKYKNNVNGRLSRSDISYIIMLISLSWRSITELAPLLDDDADEVIFTFLVSRRRRKVYILVWSRASVSACASVPRGIPTLCIDLDVTWGNGRECPVHCWQICNRCTLHTGFQLRKESDKVASFSRTCLTS